MLASATRPAAWVAKVFSEHVAKVPVLRLLHFVHGCKLDAVEAMQLRSTRTPIDSSKEDLKPHIIASENGV